MDTDSGIDAVDLIKQMLAHSAWADQAMLDTLTATSDSAAWREYAHVLGADAVWLARLEQRTPEVAVWPTLGVAEARALQAELNVGYASYLAALSAASLAESITYRNSAGQSFRTSIGDILLHVALHAQYHRGKINLLLRNADMDPSPVDYIAFVRGVPAAVTPVTPRG